MKILVLTAFEDSMRKETGGSVRIYNLAKALSQAGNSVEVVLPKYHASSELVDGVTVHALKGLTPKKLLKAVGDRLKIARATSFYFFDPLFLVRSIPLIRNADIVQIEQPVLGLMFIPFIQKLLKKPVAVDCHDVFQAARVKQTRAIRRLTETFLEKTAYKNVNLILTVSEKEKSLLVSAGFPSSKIIVAPNGVDTESFSQSKNAKQVREKYGLGNSQLVVFLGNLSYLPNIEAIQLISSTIAPTVKREVADVKFVVVGKKKGELQADGLLFTGFVDNVADVLTNADVGVAPLLHGSGTRLKILEYFSSGIPVVSTSVGAERPPQ